MASTSVDFHERLREIDVQIAALQAEASEIRIANGMGSLRLRTMMQPKGLVPDWCLSLGGDKIETIKAVRELTGLGLRESKDLVESLPQVLGNYPETHPVVKRMKVAGATFDYVDEPETGSRRAVILEALRDLDVPARDPRYDPQKGDLLTRTVHVRGSLQRTVVARIGWQVTYRTELSRREYTVTLASWTTWARRATSVFPGDA